MWLKLIIAGLGVAVVVAVICVGCATSRAGYESAPFKVVKKDGKFELREYPELVVVETPMRGADDSFMRLFRYISNQNVATQKIPMTTPVFMSGQETNAMMAFVMPKTMSAATTPQPTDTQLAVKSVPPGRFAVRQFNGLRNVTNETQALGALNVWVKTQNLQPTGSPIFGYFDPPWTLSFLRRNEVMLRVTPTK